MQMKQTLSVEVEAELVPAAELLATQRGITLSTLVEEALRNTVSASNQSFSEWLEEWRASAPAVDPELRSDDQLKDEYLADKYLR